MAFITTLDLAQMADKELGHDTSSGSTQRADIISWMDYGHKVVLAGGDLLNVDANGKKREENIVFNFARSAIPKSLVLRPAITDALVTATRGSNAITFDAAPDGSNSIAGFHMRVGGEPELYYISAHTAAATSAVIEGGYVGPANVSSNDCTLMKLRYAVGSSDVLRLVSPIQGFQADNTDDRLIDITTKAALYKRNPPDIIYQGYPEMAGMIKEADGTYTIQFSSYPLDYELVEIDYVPIPSTLDTTSVNPVIPIQFRTCLAYLACYFIGVRNNDNRSMTWLKSAQDIFRDMVKWDQNNVASIDKWNSRIRLKGFSRRLVPLTQKAYT